MHSCLKFIELVVNEPISDMHDRGSVTIVSILKMKSTKKVIQERRYCDQENAYRDGRVLLWLRTKRLIPGGVISQRT